jgi:hypothetical protein
MLAGLNASVNLVAEEEEGGEEDRYFNVARVERYGKNMGGLETPNHSWLEMEAAGEEEEGVFYVNILTEEKDEGGKTRNWKERMRKRVVRAKDRPA